MLNFLDLWSSGSKKEQMKPTNSDCLRVIGLLFSDDEMRKYIPYILSGSDWEKRLTIDEWSGKQLACYRLLYTRFIDEEYVVTFPPKWFHDHTKRKINKKLSAVGKS